MNIEQCVIKQVWKKRWFWWLALSSILTTIYFTLVWIADDTGQFCMSLLFYFCAYSTLKERYKCSDFNFTDNKLSYFLAVPLLGWVLLHSSTQTDDYTVRLFPFVSAVAIALLSSGWCNLRQYWRELTIFFFLGVPSFWAYHLIDLSPWTAKFSALMLWYTGFDIVSEGTFMALTDGRVVEVVYDCSGIDMVNYLLGMSVICLIMFPVSGWLKQFFVPLMGASIGFLVNGFRVALMVVLAKFDQQAFNNWHTGTGSYTFALLGIILLGLMYWFLMTQDSLATYSSKHIDS